ncbi:MAG: hypothetical protein ABSB19_20540 [Methylomonas sp.]|jgi:hypothetical protein
MRPSLQLSVYGLFDFDPFAKIGYDQHTLDGIYGIHASNQDCARPKPVEPAFGCHDNQGQFQICFFAIAVYVAPCNWVLSSKIDEEIGGVVEKFGCTLCSDGFP